MYGLLILLVCLSSVTPHCHDRHSCKLKDRMERYSDRQYEKLFEKTARHLVLADEQCQHNCNSNTAPQIRESFGTEFYVLKYSVPDFVEQDCLVKIKHRAIYLNARNENGFSFRDVRALPSVVKAHEGTWFMENGVLNIMFPYKIKIGTESVVACNEYINDSIQTLPRMATGITLRDAGS